MDTAALITLQSTQIDAIRSDQNKQNKRTADTEGSLLAKLNTVGHCLPAEIQIVFKRTAFSELKRTHIYPFPTSSLLVSVIIAGFT